MNSYDLLAKFQTGRVRQALKVKGGAFKIKEGRGGNDSRYVNGAVVTMQ